MKKYSILFVLFFLTLVSCTTTPKAIEYGSEGCHFCSMTIVDTQHAAQFMTQKGKTYSFDAIECLLNYLKEHSDYDIALFQISNFIVPGEFIEASKATYLVSKNIPSPMGANLSAFATEEAANKMQKENEGILYSWKELRSKFK
jgi:copper chaperone NosL